MHKYGTNNVTPLAFLQLLYTKNNRFCNLYLLIISKYVIEQKSCALCSNNDIIDLSFRPKLPSILDTLNVNKHNIEWIRNNLKSGSDNALKFDTVINSLASARATMPYEDAQLISPGVMLTALQQYGVKPKFGESAHTALTIASLPAEREYF